MKNLAIVAPSPVPFREGGAERLWNGLAVELRRQGIPTEVLKAPVRERTLGQLMAGYATFAEWDLAHFDRVLTGKYPAWAVDHPNHRLWMLHPLRGLYDRYPGHLPDRVGRLGDADLAAALELPGRLVAGAPAAEVILGIADHIERATRRIGVDHPDLAIPSPFARALVQGLDHHLLAASRVRSHAAISAEVAARPAWFPPGIDPLVVHPPLDTSWAATLAALAPPERTPGMPLRVLSVGRLERAKRHDLVIAAFQTMARPAQLRIVGAGPDADRLAELAEGDGRVELLGGLDDTALAATYGWADVVCFTSDREDYGLVTLEALTAGRGVIATSDAGGALELLTAPGSGTPADLAGDGGPNALVVAPKADALGAALDSVATTDGMVQRLGAAARTASSAVSWERTVEALVDPPRRLPRTFGPTAGAPGPTGEEADRPFVVALSTYPIEDPRQGGELRAFHLLAGLARAGARVKIVSLTTEGDRAGRRRLAPGLEEETVAISSRQSDAEHRMRLVSTTHAITDIAASLLWSATSEFAASLRAELADASAAVLVQPYLAPALAALAPAGLPVVLDAQNHEATMKAALLGGTRGGRWLARAAADSERVALDLAAAVITTTAEDAALFHRDDAVESEALHVIANGAPVAGSPFTEGAERRAIGDRLIGQLGVGALDPRTRRRLAVFVGSGHPPNVEAARRIVAATRHRDDVAVALIGRHSELLKGRLPSHIVALGRVGDDVLADYLAGADVALNPIEEGSGSNLKLVDYFAAGVPVITSTFGARGVTDPERFALLASPDRLGASLDELFADPAAAERARAARAYAEAHLDWVSLGQRMAEVTLALVRPPLEPESPPAATPTPGARP